MSSRVIPNKNVLAQIVKHEVARLNDFLEVMAEHARDASPFKTGHNRASISMDRRGLNGRVYTQSGYGGWLEIGTSRMAPRLYMRGAFDEAKRILGG